MSPPCNKLSWFPWMKYYKLSYTTPRQCAGVSCRSAKSWCILGYLRLSLNIRGLCPPYSYWKRWKQAHFRAILLTPMDLDSYLNSTVPSFNVYWKVIWRSVRRQTRHWPVWGHWNMDFSRKMEVHHAFTRKLTNNIEYHSSKCLFFAKSFLKGKYDIYA